MKFSSKQVFTLVGVVAVLMLGATYLLFFKKYMGLAEELDASNTTLQKEVDDLKVHHINKAMYLAEMEPMKEQIAETLNEYPSDNKEEDVIMQAVYTQMATPIAYDTINIGDKVVLKSVSADVVKAAGMEEYQEAISFVELSSTYANSLTYESLKEAVKSLFESDYNITIHNLTYAKGKEGVLDGTIDLSFYSVVGNGKEYEKPNMAPYVSGTDNIFGFEVVE